MTPSDLLMTLIDRGVRLKVVEDRLVYAAPRGTMTADLVEQLARHKAEVTDLLARRTCATCGSAGRCERRVPMAGGGWTCQAALDAGLLSNSETEADRRRRHERGRRPRVWLVPTRATSEQPVVASGRSTAPAHRQSITEQASLWPDQTGGGAGCGEMVRARTAGGTAWVRCTGPETCDGVCTHAELTKEAAP